MMQTDLSLPALLLRRATEEPDATAYIFMDPEVTGTGEAEVLTWAQLYRKSLVLAEELRLHGAPGDRAAILAPQGLDYIVSFQEAASQVAHFSHSGTSFRPLFVQEMVTFHQLGFYGSRMPC